MRVGTADDERPKEEEWDGEDTETPADHALELEVEALDDVAPNDRAPYSRWDDGETCGREKKKEQDHFKTSMRKSAAWRLVPHCY